MRTSKVGISDWMRARGWVSLGQEQQGPLVVHGCLVSVVRVNVGVSSVAVLGRWLHISHVFMYCNAVVCFLLTPNVRRDCLGFAHIHPTEYC